MNSSPLNLFEVLFLHSFEADFDMNVVAQPGVQLADAEFGTLEHQFRGIAGTLNALREFRRAASLERERHGLGLAVHGQVARDFQASLDRLDRGAGEVEGRELLDVEEVGALEMPVARGLLVSTLSGLIFRVNDDLAGSLESIVNLPAKLLNRP